MRLRGFSFIVATLVLLKQKNFSFEMWVIANIWILLQVSQLTLEDTAIQKWLRQFQDKQKPG
jgi:hypothetical protein